jgi:hypothetical protein
MVLQLGLKTPEAYRDQAYVNGEWAEAKSGKRFDIVGKTPSIDSLVVLSRSRK